MEEGEFTADDIRAELLENWKVNTLRDVARSLSIDLDEGQSKEEIVETILQKAPVESLLEELLTQEMQATEEDPPAEPEDSSEEAPPESVIYDTLSQAVALADSEIAELRQQVADAVPAPEPSIAPPEPAKEPPAASEESAVEEITSEVLDGLEPQEIPREMLEVELKENWSEVAVDELCDHFRLDAKGIGKQIQIRMLLDQVATLDLLKAMLDREGQRDKQEALAGTTEESVTSSDSSGPRLSSQAGTGFSVPGDAAVEDPEVPEGEDAPAKESETEPESNSEGEKAAGNWRDQFRAEEQADEDPPKSSPGAGSQDDSLLKELRSIRRESELDELDDLENEGSGGKLPWVALGLVALLVLVPKFLNPKKPRKKGKKPPTAVASSVPQTLASTSSVVLVSEPPSEPETATEPEPPEVVDEGSPGLDPDPGQATPEAPPTPEASPSPEVDAPELPTSPSSEVSSDPSDPVDAETQDPALPTPPEDAGEQTAQAEGDPEADPVDPLAELLTQAEKSLDEGDSGRGIFLLGQALEKLSPERPEAKQVRARIAELSEEEGRESFRTGKTEAAVLNFQRALDHSPERLPQVHFQLGRCYERLRRYDEAARQYQDTIESDPKFAKAHAYLAYVFRAQGRFDAALRQARLAEEKGERLDPGFKILLRYRPENSPENP